MNTSLVPHPAGAYAFLPGIAPYSSGVVATLGHELVHVNLAHAMDWRPGLTQVRRWLETQKLRCDALCGVELRCPQPHSLDSFSGFNEEYCALLREWEMLIDGQNPVARTNVSPVQHAPPETQLHAFTYVRQAQAQSGTFVVAGGGELPHRDLERQHIVRVGDTSSSAMLEKAQCVLRIMRHRLNHLQTKDAVISAVNVYTAHPVHSIVADAIIPALPDAATTGVQWYYSRPPVQEIEFEMDVRGVRQNLIVDL